MNSLWRLAGSLTIVFILAGCAATHVTYHTDPDGAMLYLKDRQLGYAPQTLEAEWNEKFITNGCLNIPGVSAFWKSGATTTLSSGRLCGGPGHYSQTILRPSDAPDLVQDVRFALDLQQVRASQEQARQASTQSQERARQASQASQASQLLMYNAFQGGKGMSSPNPVFCIASPMGRSDVHLLCN